MQSDLVIVGGARTAMAEYSGTPGFGKFKDVTAIDLADGSIERLEDIKGPALYFVTSLAYDAEGDAATEEAHARVDHDTIAKVLFPSGSTGEPKVVTKRDELPLG